MRLAICCASIGGKPIARADVLDDALRLELVERGDLTDAASRRTSRATYSMTSSRRSMQKSTSKSGMLTRSGFRKRSKSRLYGMRIEIGDPQRVRDERAGARAAARADRDAVLLRVAG